MAQYEMLRSDLAEIESEKASSVEILSPMNTSGTNLEEVLQEEFNAFKSTETLVMFNKTKLFYSLDEPLIAHFSSLSSQHQMVDDDRVGICRLENSDDFIISKSLAECEQDQEDIDNEFIEGDKLIAKKFVFQCKDVLGDNLSRAYFQFCFKNAEGKIFGKSTPFRINPDKNESMVQSAIRLNSQSQVSAQPNELNSHEEEDEFVVVRPQESFLKDRVDSLINQNSLLQYLIKSMEKDLTGQMFESKKLDEELKDARNVIKTVQKEKAKLMEYIEREKLIKEELLTKQAELQVTAGLLTDEKKSLEIQLNEAFEKIEKLEVQAKKFEVEENELRIILEDKETEIKNQNHIIRTLQAANEELTMKSINYENNIENVKSNMAQVLEERRTFMERATRFDLELQNAERELLNCRNQAQNANIRLMSELETLRAKNIRVEELESIKEKQASEIKSLEQELKTMVDNMKNFESKMQIERDIHAKKEQNAILQNDRLNLEIIEMKARVEQCKAEYGKLYRQYIAAKRHTESLQQLSEPMTSAPVQTPLTTTITKIEEKTEDLDHIDLALRNLEVEEEQINSQKSSSRSPSLISVVDEVPEASAPLQEDNVEPVMLEEAQTSVKEISNSQEYLGGVRPKIKPRSKSTMVQMPCIMCDQVIECRQHEDGSGQMHEMVQHFEEVHKQKMCPVCSTLFDTRLPIFPSYFANHIQNHFNNMRYPKSG